MQQYNGTHTNQYMCDLRTTPISPNILTLTPDGMEVLHINPKGDVYWKGRLVESDDEFKLAMLDLAKVFKGEYKHG